MTQADDDRIRSGVERRLAAVESLIPPRPRWQAAGDRDLRPAHVHVVAGPALRQAPLGGLRFGLVFAMGAVLVLLLAFGLAGGGRPEPLASAPAPTPTATGSAAPATVPGALRPVVEPRLTIPVRPTTAWTVVDDNAGFLNLAYFLDEVGATGYSVDLLMFEPRGVYDPVDETKRLPLPADLIGWIRDHPDLEAGEPVQLTVAGHPATAIDVTVTYRAGGPKGQTAQFIDDDVGSWNLEYPHRKRIVLVELRGRPLLIAFGSRPEFFEAGVGHFEELLPSIQFEDRGSSP